MYARGFYVSVWLIALLIQVAAIVWVVRFGSIVGALAAGHPRRARALLRLQQRRWPRMPARWLALREASALFWEGSFERSLQVANRLIDQGPSHRSVGWARLMRAACLVMLNRPEEARPDIAALRDGVPAVGDGLSLKIRTQILAGLVAFQEGDMNTSQRRLEAHEHSLGERNPWGALIRFQLAAIAFQQGRVEECQRMLALVLRADSELFVVRLAAHAHADLLPHTPMPSRYVRPLRQPRAAAGWRLYAQDLALGARYLCLRPPVRRTSSYAQVALLLIANLALLALLRSTEYVRGGHLLTFRVGLALVPIALYVPSTYLMARILRPRMDPARLAGALLSVLPLLTALEYLGRRLMRLPDGTMATASRLAKPLLFLREAGPMVATLAALWTIAVLVTLARRVAPRTNVLRLAAAATVFYLSWLPPTIYASNENLWAPPMEASEETYEQQQNKLAAFLYSQADAVHDAEAALLPERPGVTDLYFVGVGAWGRQDVFLHEARFAQDLFDRRFDTRGRSLVLVDDPAHGNDALPTKLNLFHVLRGVAARMNLEQDILCLFVTSHGSAQGVAFSLGDEHQGLVDEQTVSPRELHEALDGSGFRWRVLIISACQSGTFVAPLQNDSTLIVTAASGDRLSFGCTNGAEFTEFGRALLADELTRERSFTTAFANAIELVHTREQEQRRTPSMPQLFVGSAIADKLHELEDRLATLKPPRVDP